MQFTRVINQNSENDDMKLEDMFFNGLFEKAKREEEGWNALATTGLFSNVFSKFEHSSIGYGFYCFRNKSEKNIEMTLTLSQDKGVRFCK